jgi:hypothetical protein
MRLAETAKRSATVRWSELDVAVLKQQRIGLARFDQQIRVGRCAIHPSVVGAPVPFYLLYWPFRNKGSRPIYPKIRRSSCVVLVASVIGTAAPKEGIACQPAVHIVSKDLRDKFSRDARPDADMVRGHAR